MSHRLIEVVDHRLRQVHADDTLAVGCEPLRDKTPVVEIRYRPSYKQDVVTDGPEAKSNTVVVSSLKSYSCSTRLAVNAAMLGATGRERELCNGPVK
jgi:hypothetical protein